MNKQYDFLQGKKILITGGYGFFGTALTKKLISLGVIEEKTDEVVNFDADDNTSPTKMFRFRSQMYDLRKQSQCKELIKIFQPDIVIHLAANVGGIGKNMAQPATLFYDNICIGSNILHQSWLHGVKKFINICTVCAYPKYACVPFKEEFFWDGYPEETNASYGIAKKMLIVQAEAYRVQYGFDSTNLIMANLYGRDDNFDPDNSHVIPALIKKVINAKINGNKYIELWGTGTASRDFLHVNDAANAIILAIDKGFESCIMNIGTGKETTINELLFDIIKIVGWQGDIRLNETKPDGQPKRCLDTTRAKELIGFESAISLYDGLKDMIDWYNEQLNK